jgi:hypothetical protein
MRACHDDRRVFIIARTTSENVAHLIELYGASGIHAPTDKKITALPIEFCQCLSIATTIFSGTNFRHGHQALPQSLFVDPQGSHVDSLFVLFCFVGSTARQL